ncbi:bactericidal permeability-increasing protein-like [Xenopus tropicalis]|uniref:Bactericidal permeability-increasing protein n=1 Tax=Xenopus tropicalis TaxID=8364 RepID=A0A8J1J1L6_XENTR|nr:bactericidal permeability-increasing protein-like [Xenopus tropicalis]
MDFAYRLTLLFSIAAFVGTADAENPGLVVRVTQKGLDYALQEGVIALQQQLSHIQLKDISGTYGLGFLGHANYKFFSMNLGNVQLPGFQVSPIPNVGLKLSTSGGFFEVNGRWDVRYSFIHEDGTFNLKVGGLGMSIGLNLRNIEHGKPTVSVADCSCRIANVEVHMSGTIGWLVELFHGAVESEIRKELENKICPEVNKFINSDVSSFLRNQPVNKKIDHISGLDYSLMGPPSVMANWVDVFVKGKFYGMSHIHHPPIFAPPLTPPAMSLPPEQDHMVYFAVSDYVFNTALLTYQRAGALVLTLTDNMIPKKFGIHLDTNLLQRVIPSVSKMYPNMPMKLEMSAASTPALNINPGGVTLSPVGNIQAYAILPNSSLAPLFLLQAKTNAFAKVAVNSGNVVLSLENGNVEVSLSHSDVGPFSVSEINKLMNLFVPVVLPHVNDFLRNGFPLTFIEHIQLRDIVIKTYEHYLLFGANVHYH